MFKSVLLSNAAGAMASWLTENGIDAPTLERRLLAGEPILQTALNDVPRDKVGWVRGIARPMLNQLTSDDYALILAYLYEIPACRPHAELLHQRYFWSHFVPAMDEAKAWLTGSPH